MCASEEGQEPAINHEEVAHKERRKDKKDRAGAEERRDSARTPERGFLPRGAVTCVGLLVKERGTGWWQAHDLFVEPPECFTCFPGLDLLTSWTLFPGSLRP